MLTKQNIVESILEAVKKLSIDADAETLGKISVDYPDPAFGDYSSNAALILAKPARMKPLELANKIIERLNSKAYEKVEAVAPGFINFKLPKQHFVEIVGSVLEAGGNYGKSEWGKGQKWLVEHTSANPNKAMHLGHLRNNLIGMALARIWEFLGVHIQTDYISNNRGIAIAKVMWGYLKFGHKNERAITDIAYWQEHKDEWYTPEERGLKGDKFVDEYYVKGSEDAKDPEIEQQVRKLVVDWENGESANLELWRTLVDYAEAGHMQTLSRLNSGDIHKLSNSQHFWYEHEHYQEGKRYIEEGLQKGVFKKTETGAVVSDLESYKLPDTVLIKSDGTSLYITQDIALVKLKQDKFNPDKIFWVVGSEQELAMNQLYAICEQLGIGKRENYSHISYGRVSLKGGVSMSSRAGTVVYVDDLLEQVKTVTREKLADRLDGGKKDWVSEMVMLAAVKFGFLKVSRNSNMEFDLEASMEMEGNTGPYLQYTWVRANSVLRKAESLGIKPSLDNPDQEVREVERLLRNFSDVLINAATDRSPHHIAVYLNQLAQSYNSYYANIKIVDEKDKNSPYRLALTQAVQQVLKNGLQILGIEVVDEM